MPACNICVRPRGRDRTYLRFHIVDREEHGSAAYFLSLNSIWVLNGTLHALYLSDALPGTNRLRTCAYRVLAPGGLGVVARLGIEGGAFATDPVMPITRKQCSLRNVCHAKAAELDRLNHKILL